MKMREILFRGKQVDNSEWIEGDLLQIKYYNKPIIECKIMPQTPVSSAVPVISETVGQYTGLTDKNGKRIFEGDILQGEQYPFKSDGKYNYFVEVCYWADAPEFGIYTFKNPKADIRGVSEGNTDDMQDWESSDWEIIGNIHDNPELLGEEDT